MQRLEGKSDEELAAETRFRAAAQAILGARAAERMDAKRSREHFRAAIAAARPQERLQLQRMAAASLALAERRAGDLKVAAEKLGQTPPSNRQLFDPAADGLHRPAAGVGHRPARRRRAAADRDHRRAARARLGHRQARRAPVRRPRSGVSIFWGFLLVAVVLGAMAIIGRRRQARARERAAQQRADRSPGDGRASAGGLTFRAHAAF